MGNREGWDGFYVLLVYFLEVKNHKICRVSESTMMGAHRD